jgi:hypothetical protein
MRWSELWTWCWNVALSISAPFVIAAVVLGIAAVLEWAWPVAKPLLILAGLTFVAVILAIDFG